MACAWHVSQAGTDDTDSKSHIAKFTIVIKEITIRWTVVRDREFETNRESTARPCDYAQEKIPA